MFLFQYRTVVFHERAKTIFVLGQALNLHEENLETRSVIED